MEEEVRVTNLDEMAVYIGSYDTELRDIKRSLEEIIQILKRIERKT